MLRILQIGMTDNLGGIENYLYNYYRNIDKTKIQFDFVNIYPNDLCFQKELEELGAKIYKVSNYYKHPFKYIVEVVKIINENNYNVIHCNMNSAVMLYPLIAGKISKARVVIAHSHNASSDKGILKSFLHFLNKRFIPLFANYFFACSKVAGEWFYSPKIVNSSRFKIINNAVDISKFKFDCNLRLNKRRELGISNDTILIGHVGRFNKQKNQSFLVDVFYEYQKKNLDTKLMFIGVGDDLNIIKKKVHKYGIDDRVIFLNQRNDVNELMMAMDVFVLPSLYEGLPLVGVEAQASGVNCIFSDTITKELIINDNVEMLSLKESVQHWCSKIDKFIKNKTERENYNRNVSNYEIKNNSNELMNCYFKFNKIKIAHFVNGILNGGVEKVLLNYFSHMNNVNDYDLHVISQGIPDMECCKKFKQLNFTIHTVTKKQESLLRNYIDIRTILKKEKYDIVHCHMTATNFFPLLYSKISGVKIRISHSHLNEPTVTFIGKIYILLTRIFSPIKFACGNGAAKFLFGNSKKVYIMNNAIEIDKFKYDSKIRLEKRRELGIDKDIILIGHVGRFVEQKNHMFLINLIKNIDNPKYKLLLVGTGDLEKYIKEKVKDLNLSNRVIFLESRNDVNELYQAMDIFVLPSLFEGLPVVGVEAQASGLKCLVSNNVHKEIKVTDNLTFLDLDETEWIDAIYKYSSYNRVDCSQLIFLNSFDITCESNNLDEKYKSLLKGK